MFSNKDEMNDRSLPPPWQAPEDHVSMVRRHLSLLEALFKDRGLSALRHRHPSHPAVILYDSCTDYLSRLPNVPYGDREKILQELARLQMDASTWASDGQQTPSVEELIPDELARRVVLSRLPDPEQYHHTMSELFCWGLARRRGWSADLIEDEGYPDLRITTSSPQVTYAEVKTISVGSSPKRMGKIIDKANAQIKNAHPDRSGLLYVVVQREGGRARFEDRVPNDVAPYLGVAARKLASNTCRSVGAVIVLWDDLRVTTTAERMLLFVWTRTSRTLRHSNPRAVISAELLPENVGVTVVQGIVMPKLPASLQIDPFSTAVADVVTSDLLREVNELRSGLLPAHIVEVYKEPDSRTNFEISSELTVSLIARMVRRRQVDTVILLLAAIYARRPRVFSVLQLFGNPNDLSRWRYDPYDAFKYALSQYSIPLRAGGEVAPLFEHITLSEGGLVSVKQHPEQILCSHLRRRSGPFGELTEYVWAHVIDVGRYRSAVEAAYSR